MYIRPNGYATKHIAIFEENPDITKLSDLFQNAAGYIGGIEDKDVEPSVVANDIFAYFKAEDDRRQVEQDAARKKSQAAMSARYKKTIARIKNEPPKPHAPESLEYQLGIMIGDFIVSKYLPTLSTDGIQTNNVVEVSVEDTIENERLHNLWSDRIDNKDLEKEIYNQRWEEYREHSKILQRKYLPHILECYIPRISSINKPDDLIKGIRASLWDCDCSNYDTDKMEIINDDGVMRNSVIKLHLSHE